MPEAVEPKLVPPAETDFFPRNPQDELQHLRELAGDRDVTIFPLGDAGYIVHKNKLPGDRPSVIAEAPWALLDFDDTAAKTTQDKAECWDRLGQMGFDSDVVAYCDKRCRVYLGDEEQAYEPELEMRLLAAARPFQKDGRVTLTPQVKEAIEKARRELLETKDLEGTVVPEDIENLYNETRFSSTLYPDTVETLRALKRVETDRPLNIGILTYGDPSFQFAKTRGLLDTGVVSDIFVTKVRKGKYFEELVTQNPFKDLDLQYTYDETPRGVGIDFKNWKIIVQLFDDDPSQVKSFNEVATRLGLAGLGVTRVRRPGVKRAEKDTDLTNRVGEIRPTDTYIDTHLFLTMENELRGRIIEDDIVEQIKQMGVPPFYQIRPVIDALSGIRGISPAEQIAKFAKRGINFFTMIGDEPIERPEAYQVVHDDRDKSA